MKRILLILVFLLFFAPDEISPKAQYQAKQTIRSCENSLIVWNYDSEPFLFTWWTSDTKTGPIGQVVPPGEPLRVNLPFSAAPAPIIVESDELPVLNGYMVFSREYGSCS